MWAGMGYGSKHVCVEKGGLDVCSHSRTSTSVYGMTKEEGFIDAAPVQAALL